MGKALVVLFLTSLLMALLTAGLAIYVYTAGIVEDLLSLRIGQAFFDPSSFPVPRWAAVFFHLSLLYFTFAFLLAIVFFAISLVHPARKIRPAKPLPQDGRERSIVAVIPAYNEEEAIGPVVDEFRAVPGVKQVLVVDNNCTDRTVEVARAHGAQIVREDHQGWGHACIRGLRAALEETDAEVIVLTEADMTYFAEDLRKLVPHLSEVDMAVGSRSSWYLTEEDSQLDWFLAWGNLFVAFLVRLRYWDPIFLGRLRLSDVGCTLRAIRRDALVRLMPHLRVGGAYFPLHMTLEALRTGMPTAEVPVRFRRRVGQSKIAAASRSRATSLGLQMITAILLD